MEIMVVYADYTKEVKSAKIDLGEDQWVEIGYVDEVVVDEIATCEGTEEIPLIPIEPVETVLTKLEIKHIDETTMLEISNKMALEEIAKYIALLQRFAKQLQNKE